MKLKIGDTIFNDVDQYIRVERVILEVRKTGYTWKYPESDRDYWSENSSDPFFDGGWVLKK